MFPTRCELGHLDQVFPCLYHKGSILKVKTEVYIYYCCEVISFLCFFCDQNPDRLSPVSVDLVGNIREKIMLLPVPKSVFNECKQ